MIARRLLPLLSMLLLVACAQAQTSATPTSPSAGPADQVDHSCEVDADCEIKNVGNCCGYYPACVNKDSPTFPEQVKAECEREGRMSICGFPSLSGCRCVEQRCEGIEGPSSDAEAQ